MRAHSEQPDSRSHKHTGAPAASRRVSPRLAAPAYILNSRPVSPATIPHSPKVAARNAAAAPRAAPRAAAAPQPRV